MIRELYLPRTVSDNLAISTALDIINSSRSNPPLSRRRRLTNFRKEIKGDRELNLSDHWSLLIDTNVLKKDEALEIIELTKRYRLYYDVEVEGFDNAGPYKGVIIKKVVSGTETIIGDVRIYPNIGQLHACINGNFEIPPKILRFIAKSIKPEEKLGTVCLAALQSAGQENKSL